MTKIALFCIRQLKHLLGYLSCCKQSNTEYNKPYPQIFSVYRPIRVAILLKEQLVPVIELASTLGSRQVNILSVEFLILYHNL